MNAGGYIDKIYYNKTLALCNLHFEKSSQAADGAKSAE